MPYRPEPENDVSRKTLPAPSSQHGPAQHLPIPTTPRAPITPLTPISLTPANNRETITTTANPPQKAGQQTHQRTKNNSHKILNPRHM